MHDTIEQIAAELGVSRWAVQKWNDRRSVPPRWQIQILKEAQKRGINLCLAHFDGFRWSRARERVVA